MRYDELNNQTDAVDMPAGRFVPARSFPAVKNVPNWQDFNPRLGASYDLFGDGRTAVKVGLESVRRRDRRGRHHPGQPPGHDLGDLRDEELDRLQRQFRAGLRPDQSAVEPRVRPDLEPELRQEQSECDALRSGRAGRAGASATTTGKCRRRFSASCRGRVSATFAYYRRWYGNVTATDNLDVTPADFDPFCITLPADARLPGGGGNRQCGYYNVSQAKFGQVHNYITLRYRRQLRPGDRGLRRLRLDDQRAAARGAQVSGGVSLGRTATNTCGVVDSPQESLFCEVAPPFQPNIKAQGVYALPWYGVAARRGDSERSGRADHRDLHGDQRRGGAVARAQLVVRRRPGRWSVPIIQPGTLYEKRQTQLDLRLSKRFVVQRARILGSIDMFNILNLAGIDAVNTNYGPIWLRPTRIQGTRYVKFSAQLDF